MLFKRVVELNGITLYNQRELVHMLKRVQESREDQWSYLFERAFSAEDIPCIAWLLQRRPALALKRSLLTRALNCYLDQIRWREHVHIIHLLLQAGADVNYVDHLNWHPLYELDRALIGRHLDHDQPGWDLVDMLFEHGSIPPKGCSMAMILRHHYYLDARARIRRARIALWACFRARGWPRDLVRIIHFSHRDMEWRDG